MLKSMRAVVTPQTVINGCLAAVEATGLGRGNLLDGRLVDHFAFCVPSDDYIGVSEGLQDMLDGFYSVKLPHCGNATMGLQKLQDDKGLSWYYGNRLPALAAVSSQNVPLLPGGGYVAVRAADLRIPHKWLRDHDAKLYGLEPYGIDAIWVPLQTPEWGIGPGYYALCVVTEPLLVTARRLSADK